MIHIMIISDDIEYIYIYCMLLYVHDQKWFIINIIGIYDDCQWL